MSAVDFEQLRARAIGISKLAYAPYSQFPVGAAGLVEDGRIVSGCNVENAAYGVGLCAECGMISELIAGGGGRLLAVTCCNKLGERLMPCGRCRQLLFEHGGGDLLVDTPLGPKTMNEILPQAFGPAELDHVKEQ
jgi:cytidine deaminase